MGKSLDFSDQFSWSWKENREHANTVNPSSKPGKWYCHVIGEHTWSEGLSDFCRISGWMVGSFWRPFHDTAAASEHVWPEDSRWITCFAYLYLFLKGKDISYLPLYFAVSFRDWQNKKKPYLLLVIVGIDWKICINMLTYLVKKASCRIVNKVSLRKNFERYRMIYYLTYAYIIKVDEHAWECYIPTSGSWWYLGV